MTHDVVDWEAVYRKLMHGDLHYRPWEIRQLTLPEVLVALDDKDLDKPRPPRWATGVPNTPEYRTWLRGLSVRQRLELARDGKVKS